MVEVDMKKLLNIEELSREVCYGASFEPIGYFSSSCEVILIVRFKDKATKCLVVDKDLTMVVDRFQLEFGNNLSELFGRLDFSTDIVMMV